MSRPASNVEFAERVGCHFSTVSRMRSGERMPSAGMLARIVKTFKVTPLQLADLMKALEASPNDPAPFGCWLNRCVFGTTTPPPPKPTYEERIRQMIEEVSAARANEPVAAD